mgnify:CR=1 FL=1
MDYRPKILIVEDQASMQQLLEDFLEPAGFEITSCDSATEACALLGIDSSAITSEDFGFGTPAEESNTSGSPEIPEFALVLTDVKMPGIDGLEFCRRVKQRFAHLPVIVMTAYGSLETAVEALRAGAFDFVTKPVELALLKASLIRAAEYNRLRNRIRVLESQIQAETFDTLIGQSDVMLRLKEQLSRVVDSPAAVLLTGESGSGKSTLLNCISGQLEPSEGDVLYRTQDEGMKSTQAMTEPELRKLRRTEWAFVHQNPRDGLRLSVSAGGNVGERLMAIGARHYGDIRNSANEWLERVEISTARIDDRPSTFSGGMQQRLQIARNLVTHPRLIFMDEPTGGLDVSVQARLLDLLRSLVRELGLSAIIVTHDLAVVRLLADRLMVMRGGSVVEQGLTDQVLDDPQHPYTQLLVSSVLMP